MGEEEWNGDSVQPCVPKKRTTIYVEPNTDGDFRKICDREGVSVSKKLEEYMLEYVARHKAGNPQLLISNYVKMENMPMRVLCHFCEGATSEGMIHCEKKDMWIKGIECYSCKLNRLRKK